MKQRDQSAVAFLTTALGIDCVVFACSEPRARFVTWRSGREAGFDVRWSNLKSRRARELDKYAATSRADRCLSLERVLAGHTD